jgi:hypothetical protein
VVVLPDQRSGWPLATIALIAILLLLTNLVRRGRPSFDLIGFLLATFLGALEIVLDRSLEDDSSAQTSSSPSRLLPPSHSC